jgi:hypothetical protein
VAKASTKTCENSPCEFAKPLFIGPIPIAASKTSIIIREYSPHGLVSQVCHAETCHEIKSFETNFPGIPTSEGMQVKASN